MASEALGIPIDVPWRRLAWSRDMLDRRFLGALPLKWRSSTAIYAYPVPIADTDDDYPDARIVYLKFTASITGWSPRELLDGHLVPDPSQDPWQRAAWELIAAARSLTHTYWPCVSAIAQIAIYPRPEEGVADEDFPHIVDFEPKKRELYESVSEAKELLSGSSQNANVRKGNTTTQSVELSTGTDLSSVGVPVNAQATYGWQREHVDITTTDHSTDQRETVGRTTQLSQMYQLFNGYHIGTNRGVFALFPRPHIATDAAQADNNLVNGLRWLEGVQDIFLVVHVPRSIPGICVRTLLETGHKLDPTNDRSGQLMVTRRTVSGCGEFDGDRLVSRPPPEEPPRHPEIVGDHQIASWDTDHRTTVGDGRKARVKVADQLNHVQTDIRAALLGDAASGAYAPRALVDTDLFRRLASIELRALTLELSAVAPLGHVSPDDVSALRRLGIATVGDLFQAGKHAGTALVTTVRSRLLDAMIKTRPSG